MGAKPVATIRESLEISSIKEAEGVETAEQMVQAVVDDFSAIIQDLDKGIKVAEEVNDEATGDMLLDIKVNLEKHNWMLKSFLGK